MCWTGKEFKKGDLVRLPRSVGPNHVYRVIKFRCHDPENDIDCYDMHSLVTNKTYPGWSSSMEHEAPAQMELLAQ